LVGLPSLVQQDKLASKVNGANEANEDRRAEMAGHDQWVWIVGGLRTMNLHSETLWNIVAILLIVSEVLALRDRFSKWLRKRKRCGKKDKSHRD
jgi:phosphodiesterase/alkaline phosphatase D-like protein